MKLSEYIKFMRELGLYVTGYENDFKNKCYYIHYLLNVQIWTEILYKKDMHNLVKINIQKQSLIERVNYYTKKGV